MQQQQVFRASRFEDAMAQVRRTLGTDALIVSRRQLRSSSGLRSESPMVEITAMSAALAAERGLLEGHASPADRLLRRLIDGGVPNQAAKSIVQRMRAELLKLDVGPHSEASALAESLSQEMLFCAAIGSGSRVAALIGPTGVGKTTTIAKLAAQAALVEGKRVGLVCLDQYRVGGVEQLHSYAELIGVPMTAASDGRSFKAALDNLCDADLIFVDTAGRSPRDSEAASELHRCLCAAQEPVERYLCLPAAMRRQEISLTLTHNEALQPTRLISTKADEAVCCSGIVAAQASSGLPVAYVTTGQRVPEDIERATPQLLADLLSGTEEWSS